MLKKSVKISLIVVISMIINLLSKNSILLAQQFIVKGKIKAMEKPLENVLITIYSAANSKVLKTAVSDNEGFWQTELKNVDSLSIEFSYVGFEIKKIYINKSSQLDLGIVTLEPKKNNGNEVVVTAKKPLIEFKAGKMIVNVAASPSNVGASVMDVLEKSPGISIDKDGNISLKGKQGIVVMIDKKPTYMSQQDLANYLKNMPSNQLEQIEIITQPGSNYDAAGNSGIINLKLKKSNQKGSNGSITTGYTQGIYARNNESFNYNYKKNKVRFFTNISYDYNRRKKELEIERLFIDPQTKALLTKFNQDAIEKQTNEYVSAKLGLDYQLDSFNTIGIITDGSLSTGNENWLNTGNIKNISDVIVSKSNSNQISKHKYKNASLNLNWRRNISKSKLLSADIDIIGYNNFKDQQLKTQYFNGVGIPNGNIETQKGDLPANINIYLGKIDFEKNYKTGAKLELGAKTSYVKTNNSALFFMNKNNVWVTDSVRTNQFNYSENINAAYVSYSFNKGKKWNFNIGTRVEHTLSKGLQKINDSSFTKNYINVFPTIFATYSINDNRNISISFGRRIQRPDYEDLNPFRFYIDQYTYESGNVFLQPQFSYNTEINYSTMQGALNQTATYSYTNKIITDVIEQNEITNETYITKKNIAVRKNFNYSISFNKSLNKWFTTSLYGQTTVSTLSGLVNGKQEKINVFNYMFNVNNQFKISKTIKAELSGFYRGKGGEDLIVITGILAVNAGISKTILQGKGTLRLSARDIFNTQNAKGIIKYGDINTNFLQRNDRQTIGLSFTYRFNKGIKFQGLKNKQADEKSRVKNQG